jgi:transposase
VPHNFLPYNQDQLFLLPPSLNEWVSENSLPRFVSDLVDALNEQGRLESFYANYREDGWGRAAYHPCLMIKVIVYGYAVGVRSSRKLEEALERDVGFRFLAANQKPNFRTLSEFRKENLDALSGLFIEVLELSKSAGLVDLGVVALDGRKLPGNAAPKHNRNREQLEKLVQEILQEAQETDEREDALFGKENNGRELPPELQTREGRLKRIREAIAQADAKKKAVEESQAERVQVWDEQRKQGKARGRKPSEQPRQLPLKRAEEYRVNPTDPESRPLKTRRGWIQGYNGQAMVECSHQIIVAYDLTAEADDRAHLDTMLQRCEALAGRRPDKCLGDAGYWSEANARAGGKHTELFIAVDNEGKTLGHAAKPRQKTKQQPEAVKMRAKLKTEEGRTLYSKRAQTAEPVFGQMCMRELNRFWLRGVQKVRCEWALFCMTHNLLKVWRSGWQPNPA